MHIIWAIIFLSRGWGALSYNPNVHTHGQNRCVYYQYIDCTRVEDCSFLENSLLLFCIRYLFLRFFSVFPQGQEKIGGDHSILKITERKKDTIFFSIRIVVSSFKKWPLHYTVSLKLLKWNHQYSKTIFLVCYFREREKLSLSAFLHCCHTMKCMKWKLVVPHIINLYSNMHTIYVTYAFKTRTNIDRCIVFCLPSSVWSKQKPCRSDYLTMLETNCGNIYECISLLYNKYTHGVM